MNGQTALRKGDYMGRVAGSIFISEGSDLPWVGTVPEWKSCKRNVVNARRTTAASGRRLLAALEVRSASHRAPPRSTDSSRLCVHVFAARLKGTCLWRRRDVCGSDIGCEVERGFEKHTS